MRRGVRLESSQRMDMKEGYINVQHSAWPSKSFILIGYSSYFTDFIMGGLFPLFSSRCLSTEQALVVQSDGHVKNHD